jgi:glycosyltransferase involved in cell wall biosynthesis
MSLSVSTSFASTTKDPNASRRRPLRLVMFGSRGIPHTYGGAEEFLKELAPRLVERGHEVTVYCRSTLFKDRLPSWRGVQLRYLPNIETKVLGTPTHTLACMTRVAFQPTDVVFVVNIVNGFHCALLRLMGKKFAINVDGLDWLRGKWGAVARKYFYLNAKCIGSICPDGVVTDATEMQRIYQDDFGTPSTMIAYGANILRSQNPDAVRKYGLEPFKYYLIASRMVPENNADLILKAFERLRSDKILAVAGGANYKSEFVQALRQTRDPRIKFLDHVGDADDVNELHLNAYAYVHGHSLGGINPSLVKALGCGNCVIALNTPFNKEVLWPDYGLLFEKSIDDLLQKLQQVEDDPRLAQKYRNQAPKRIEEEFNWEKITDKYEELFLRLAER